MQPRDEVEDPIEIGIPGGRGFEQGSFDCASRPPSAELQGRDAPLRMTRSSAQGRAALPQKQSGTQRG